MKKKHEEQSSQPKRRETRTVALYLDNFRGFSKTTIPLKSVNFLIGENSTGKSSFLALVNLLCSAEFWFSQTFNLQDYEFGGFRDILSATAFGETHFTIGVSQKLAGEKRKAVPLQSYVLSYSEREALPVVDFVARLDGRKLLVLREVEGKYKFRTGEVPSGWVYKDDRDLFSLLVKERDRGGDDLQDLPRGLPSKVGFIPLLPLLEMIVTKRHRGQSLEIPFPFPIFSPGLVWFAPIRTRPKRTYDGYGRQFSPEGEHTPYLLLKRLSGDKPNEFRTAIEAFGKASGLYHRVLINRLGKDLAAPFELLVELAARYPLRVNSVGYGVSQALPLVVEMLARREGSWFAIQQPEVHLHPRAQAALGDLIFQVAESHSKKFLVETHSDFTVDRFRMNFRKTPKHNVSAQVLFFERTKMGNQVSFIPIRGNGEYPEEQPSAFREFFLQEQISLLRG